MSKKYRLSGLFNKWHRKRAETQHLYHIYWSLWRQFRFERSVLVICKILGLFVNPFNAGYKYSLLERSNLLQHFQMPLSQKRKVCSESFFLHFLNLDSILYMLEKKMTLIADVFLNWRTSTNMVRWIS